MQLDGKRVVITGASRGIGESMAHAFAAAGARVALVARSKDAIERLAEELGGSAYYADLSDPAQVSGLIERIETDGGQVDVLVNNAGLESSAGLCDAPDDELRRVIEVNLVAPAELCRQAIPRMLGRGGGHIVNVSSCASAVVFPGLVSYSASKAGLSHFTAGLRVDLRGLPIDTTLVELGPIPTDMLAKTKNYVPTDRSFRRYYRTHLTVDVPRETVARKVVEAVQKNRKHVRVPKRNAPFAMMVEIPRRTSEILLTGVPHQAK